jgi:hypothetical protein
VRLDGEQLVLDTNILVHWLRGKDAALKLRQDYELGARRPRPIVPVVVKAEIKSLALQFGWGQQRHEALDALLRELPVADTAPKLSSKPTLVSIRKAASSGGEWARMICGSPRWPRCRAPSLSRRTKTSII